MNVLCYLDERITNINIQKTGTAMTNIILFTVDSQTFKLSASTVIANSGLHRVGILNFQMKVEVVAMLSIFFFFLGNSRWFPRACWHGSNEIAA